MCIEQWGTSFAVGSLSNRKTLREALAYRNYLDSPEQVQVEVVSLIEDKNCDDALVTAGIFPTETQCCLGAEVAFPGITAYFVIDGVKLLPNTQLNARQPPIFLAEHLRKLKRNVLFISNWLDDSGKPVFTDPGAVDCGDLLKALGVCKTWEAGDTLLVLALAVGQGHKPTWLDSNLVFYWYAAPHRPEWGLTRSLETGRTSLREWVLSTRKSVFEVMEYWSRPVEQAYKLEADNLDNGYWETCAKEIRA